MNVIKLLPLILVLSTALHAKDRLFWSSIAAISAGSAIDAYTSWHAGEANHILATHGRFAAKGIVIKTAALSPLLLQIKLRHRQRIKNGSTIYNFAGAAVFGGVAIRNR